MAEQLVVTQTLTAEMVDAGADLLRTLDSNGFNTTAALWLYLESSDSWRLIIGSPAVEADGPKRVYEKVQKVLSTKRNGVAIGLRDISVVAPNDARLVLLGRAVKTGSSDISGIRFSRNTVNGQFIQDAYIYRLS
ncbi:MAG: hypothetical protein ABR589_01525 [Chthoniobacterales bacterium]